MSAMEPVDIVVLVILGIAILRGLLLGLIREAFSIAALGGACIAVKLFTHPAAAWLEATAGGQIGPLAARWIAGAVLAVGTIVIVGLAGRVVRRGARWAGLSFADRAGGALLGATEGALVAAILLAIAIAVLGRDHPSLASSRSLDVLEQVERIARDPDARTVDVAAPPPPRGL